MSDPITWRDILKTVESNGNLDKPAKARLTLIGSGELTQVTEQFDVIDLTRSYFTNNNFSLVVELEEEEQKALRPMYGIDDDEQEKP